MGIELKETDPIMTEHLFAVRCDGLTFLQCAEAALTTPELVAQVDRLYGTNLQFKGAPIELAIDKATGRLKHDLEIFCRFVWNFVFTRIPFTKP
jgi:hypothetical protein